MCLPRVASSRPWFSRRCVFDTFMYLSPGSYTALNHPLLPPSGNFNQHVHVAIGPIEQPIGPTPYRKIVVFMCIPPRTPEREAWVLLPNELHTIGATIQTCRGDTLRIIDEWTGKTFGRSPPNSLSIHENPVPMTF